MGISIRAFISVLLVCVFPTLALSDATQTQYDLGYKAYSEEKDYDKALRILKPLAIKGHGESQYFVGKIYYSGPAKTGPAQDYKEAMKWLKKAAENGNLDPEWRGYAYDAMFRIADQANWDEENPRKALRLLEPLIQQGHDKSIADKSIALASNIFTEKGFSNLKDLKAFSLLWEPLVKQGHPKAIKLKSRITANLNFRLKNEKFTKTDCSNTKKLKITGRRVLSTISRKFNIVSGLVDRVDVYNHNAGLEAYEAGDYATAFAKWEPLAKEGSPEAQFNVGNMYALGEGVIQDYKTAVKWYRLADKQGDVSAQFSLGEMYRQGKGVPRNINMALKCLEPLAEMGDEKSQVNVGLAYDEEGDNIKAVKWYRRAAEQGNKTGMINLGVMHENGEGLIKSNVYAQMWYNVGASSRDISKNMTPAEIVSAQKLARECVRKKYKGCNVGLAYDEKPGDKIKAVKWFKRAAEQGDNIGMINLGRMYDKGQEVKKSNVHAHMWFNLAASSGHSEAGGLRDDISKKMTPAEIVSAQKLARECIAKKYKGC